MENWRNLRTVRYKQNVETLGKIKFKAEGSDSRSKRGSIRKSIDLDLGKLNSTSKLRFERSDLSVNYP